MKILLLAGEESGALYAKQIAAAVKRLDPSAEIRGFEDYGFHVADLAVIGVVRVALKIRYFMRVKRTLERAIDDWRPDVVCTVDYPGMNLRLGAYAKAKGIRAVHVVCPQVWAWKQSRIPRVEASFDRLCCFFPFEPSLFRPGFATFVGHPLVEAMRAEAAAAVPAPGAGRRLALLPGSRLGEIQKILPVLLEAVRILWRTIPDLRVEIPAANARARKAIDRELAAFRASVPAADGLVNVRTGGARELLREADAAAVASGTATLEAALALCPTVLVYKVDWFFAIICRIVIKGVRHIGLANIIAEKAGAPCPMPELLQENLRAEAVAAHLRPWLVDPAARKGAVAALEATMALLRSDGGAIEKIAAEVVAGREN